MKDILSPVSGLTIDSPDSDIDQLCPRSETKKTYKKSTISDSERIHIMEETQCCYRCGIGFRQVGLLSLEERLENHEQYPHVIKCGECEDSFISYTHLKYHIETQHDARCADCCSFCNRTCSIQYAMKTELTATWMMEDGIADKKDAVAGAMEGLERCVKDKTQRHMTMVEDMARHVDAGFDGPEAIYWSRLVYIPHPKTLDKNVSTKVKEWVHLSEFEMALDEQMAKIKLIVIKKCPMQRCNSSFIDEWDHRWGYHPDSSNYHWAPGPNPAAFLETTVQTTALKGNKDPTYWDPQAKNPEVTKTEIDDEKPVVTKREEASVSLSEKELEKGNIRGDIVTNPACTRNENNITESEVTSAEKPGAETIAINGEGGAMERPETMANKITGAAYTSPQPDPPMGNHPAGRQLSGVAVTNMKGKGESGQHKHASSGREYESENCHTLPYDNQKIEAGYNLSPPNLIESEYESESDTEADATAGTFLNHWPDTTPGTGKVILECKTGSVPFKNLDIIRRRYVQNSNSGRKFTATDAEACADPGTGHKMSHHPVGRKTSVLALSDTTGKISLSCDHQPPGRPLPSVLT